MKFLLLATALASAVFAKVPEWHAHYRMNTADYQSTFDSYLGKGFKVNSVSGYERDGEPNYAAIFEKNEAGVAWWSHTRMSSAAYQQKFDKYVGQGYRLRQVNGYNVAGETYYAAVWDKTPSGPWVSRHGMDEAGLKKYFAQYVDKEGYRLVHASGYEVKGEARYAAIWEKTGEEDVKWASWVDMSADGMQKRFDDYLKDGYRLTDVAGYAVKDTVYYAGVWDNSTSGAWEVRSGMDSPGFQKNFDKFKADGYVIDVLNGYDTPAGDRYAAIWSKH